MFEKIKNSLVVENIKLKKKVNKLELDIEILKEHIYDVVSVRHIASLLFLHDFGNSL